MDSVRTGLRCSAMALGLMWVQTAVAGAPVAITENGRVTGVVAEDMREFLGVRYAAPPVGVLRWQPPQPVAESMATTVAAAFAPHCPQLASPYGVASTTEDCLYLNVYTPNKTRAANAPKLPVMFWIHGGALVVGESDAYDPVRFVTEHDVIVVTINYRLGYLGFLAEAGLDAEGHVRANYGLLDQQFALDWVRRNISGFGGNPDKITIFGESAGGQSVLANLVSPTAYGLFNQAIVESGAYALSLPSLAQAEGAGASIAAGLGCATADTACLRGASVAQVLALETSPTLSLTAIVDGTTLPLSINSALKAGRFNRVPLLNGSNHDEYRQFLSADAKLTAAEYPFAVAGVYGATLGAAIVKQYPVTDYAKPILALAAVITDQTFACTARQVDRWAAQYVPVYAYEFNDRNAPEDFLPPAGYNFGASHASELQFLFKVPTTAPIRPLDPAETTLSRIMVDYWADFAHAALPDGRRVPYWSPYAEGADIFQSLVPAVPAPEQGFSAVHHCGFWNPLINPA